MTDRPNHRAAAERMLADADEWGPRKPDVFSIYDGDEESYLLHLERGGWTREHEAVHPLPGDPDTIHCLCGMWFDDFWQWTDHVSPLVEAAVADPATIRAIRKGARP